MTLNSIWQAFAGLRPGRHRVLTGLLLLMAMSWGNAVWAVSMTNCTPRAYTISPAISGLVNVPQTVGTTLYTGTVSMSFTCDFSSGGGFSYIVGGNVGVGTFVRNSGKTLALRLTPGSQSFSFLPAKAGSTCTTIGGVTVFSDTDQNYVNTLLMANTGNRCTWSYSFGFRITVAATPTVDTNFPPDNGPTDILSQSPNCTLFGSTQCNWLNDTETPALTNSGGAFAARFVKITCTLSTPNTTVALNPPPPRTWRLQAPRPSARPSRST